MNGDSLIRAAGSTIADVVARLIEGAEPKGIAVAVDRCVIPRSEWATTRGQARSADRDRYRGRRLVASLSG